MTFAGYRSRVFSDRVLRFHGTSLENTREAWYPNTRGGERPRSRLEVGSHDLALFILTSGAPYRYPAFFEAVQPSPLAVPLT